MQFTKVWTDGHGLYILETQAKGTMRYGVLANTKGGSVGLEEPVDSIASRLPYSEWQEVKGGVPPEVASLVKNGIPQLG